MRSALLLAAIGLSLAGRGSAPAQMHLVFDGRHNASFLHQGTFVNSASWCPSGTAVDESVDASTDTAVRRFSCLGGGEFTAKIQPLPAEHGGSGSWQIVGGTGALADLRGKGTFTSVRLSGSSDDPASITFRSTWDGVAGFDATPPAVAVASASARVINRAQRVYRLRLSLSVTDAESDAIAYVLQVADPRKPSATLVYKVGKTAPGTVTATFRIKAPKGAKVLRITLDATDAVGNQASIAKVTALK